MFLHIEQYCLISKLSKGTLFVNQIKLTAGKPLIMVGRVQETPPYQGGAGEVLAIFQYPSRPPLAKGRMSASPR